MAQRKGFKLSWKVEGDITRLTRDKPRHGMPGLGVRLKAQVKCIYTNACNMGNKKEGLEAIVQQDSYDFVAITEIQMTLMTGVLQRMAISSSEGIGEEREVVGWHCVLGTALIV